MAIPRAYSYTWSDSDGEGTAQATVQAPAPDDSLGLRDKELHLWAAYPETKRKKTKRQPKARRNGGKGEKKRKLWAVVIVESLERQDDWTYGVTLKRIFKADERSIKIWVRNDPADQSEEAAVFGITSPRNERLTPLEEQLTMWAAKRVYDAIADAWPCPEASPEGVDFFPRNRKPK